MAMLNNQRVTILATKKIGQIGVSWNWSLISNSYVDAYLPWLTFGLIRGGSAGRSTGKLRLPDVTRQLPYTVAIFLGDETY